MHRNSGSNVSREDVETLLARPLFVWAGILPRILNATFKYTVPWLDVGINLTKLTGIRIKTEWAYVRALLSAFQPSENISLWLQRHFCTEKSSGIICRTFLNSYKLYVDSCSQKTDGIISEQKSLMEIHQHFSNRNISDCCVGIRLFRSNINVVCHVSEQMGFICRRSTCLLLCQTCGTSSKDDEWDCETNIKIKKLRLSAFKLKYNKRLWSMTWIKLSLYIWSGHKRNVEWKK